MMKNQPLVAFTSELQALNTGDTMYITSDILTNIKWVLDIIGYKLPLTVTEYTAYATVVEGVYDDYELCPRCGLPLERTYQPFCDKCGQSLRWISKRDMQERD